MKKSEIKNILFSMRTTENEESIRNDKIKKIIDEINLPIEKTEHLLQSKFSQI